MMRKSELRRRLKASQDARRENGEYLSRIIMDIQQANDGFTAQIEDLQQQLIEMTNDRDGWRALADAVAAEAAAEGTRPFGSLDDDAYCTDGFDCPVKGHFHA